MCRLKNVLGCAIWLLFFVCIQQQIVCDDAFEDSVNKCLCQKDRSSVSLPMEIVNDKGALELWFHHNGKYDLYLTYNNGHIYYNELQINTKNTPRIGADRANCSNYLLPTPNWYNCPYLVNEDDHRVNVTLEIYPPVIIYSIDKATKEVHFIKDTTGVFGTGTEQSQIDCMNKITANGTPLPIEVERKGNHLEVTVKYQGKYDVYNTIDLGTICGIQYQLDEKPNSTVEDYAHCSKCGSFSSYFWCPYKLSDDGQYVTVSLEAFFYKNVYKINKSSGQVTYEKSLSGIDPHKSFEKDINHCLNVLSEKNASIPVQVVRNRNFLEIWIKHKDKYDLFETGLTGSICRRDLQTSREPDAENLVPRAPAVCFSPGEDVPYYFICPYDVLEDDDYIYFRIYTSDQYLYAFKKETKELVYRKFPTIYDSGHQGTVEYLRSVVKDANFY